MQKREGTVLITGSSGLIGSAVMEQLAPHYTVVGLDINVPDRLPAGAGFLELDLGSDESVQGALEQVRRKHGDRIASVIHLAAYYDFAGEPSPLYEEITINGTGRLLRGMKRFQTEQFLFSSTMLVHKPCRVGEKIHEDWPLQPKWDYPRSKVETEKLLRAEHGDVPLVLMRVAGVYDDRCHSPPLANQIQRINERWITSYLYPGDISCGQAFLHLDDLIDAIERAVERRKKLPPVTTLLIGEPETLSFDDLQRAFGRLIHDEHWVTELVPKPVAKAGAWVQDHMPATEEPFIKPWMVDLADDHYELDITQARTQLGWGPKHSLRDELANMIAFLKSEPLTFYQENGLTPPSQLKQEAGSGASGKERHER